MRIQSAYIVPTGIAYIQAQEFTGGTWQTSAYYIKLDISLRDRMSNSEINAPKLVDKKTASSLSNYSGNFILTNSKSWYSDGQLKYSPNNDWYASDILPLSAIQNVNVTGIIFKYY